MTMLTGAARPHRAFVTAALAAALWMLAGAGPSGQASRTPQELFARAQSKEQAARTADAPSAPALRGAATAYELVFRAYPASGYADDAVWLCARLLADAAAASGSAADARKAERWFKWLREEYPDSGFARRVDTELQALARPATPTPPPPAGPAQIRSISVSPLPQGQRVTIELSQEVAYASERVNGPDRVYFDFTNTTVSAAIIERAHAVTGGLIRSTRFGHPQSGVTRVVFDLDGRPRFSAFTYYEPFRVLIDLVDTTGAFNAVAVKPAESPAVPTAAAPKPDAPKSDPAGAGRPSPDRSVVDPQTVDPPVASDRTPKRPAAPPAVATPPASATHDGGYTLGRQLGLGVSRIVIDAGHGGHDPGAAAHGVTEAELVLDVARRLEKLLSAEPGFHVVLTRDTDHFIPLEERTAIANREGADLFLSIHANASRDTSARGVETYFLNFATNASAEAVAARENALSAQNMGDITDIVKAITLNNKVKESRELATFVQTSLMRSMSQQNRALKDLGVKQAPFVVLIGARMPSVLAEVSFLTNKNEAALLKQPTFRQRIAQALCDAVVKYQGSLKKVTTVAAKAAER